MFNRKRIHELEQQIQHQAIVNLDLIDKIESQRKQIEHLIRIIRQTDDIIFSMGQCTDWESMRPRFSQLHDQMTSRKVIESNRIGDLVRDELVKTYDGQTNISQIGAVK